VNPRPLNSYDRKIALLEAALYIAGRPLDTKTLGSIIGTRSKRKIRALVRVLARKYSQRHGALELVEVGADRFVLQLKPRYVPQMRRFSMRPLLSAGPLKTLSYIAYKQPIAQAHVAEVMGSHIYKYIQKLERMGLIATKKQGRTKTIRTTAIFADYFNLSRNCHLMKQQLTAIFKPNNETASNQNRVAAIAKVSAE
jgi:segregation and condensation protein B